MSIIRVSKEVVDVLLCKGVLRDRALNTMGRLKGDNPDLFRMLIEAVSNYDLEVRKSILDVVILLMSAVYCQEEVNEMEDSDGDVWIYLGDEDNGTI